MSETIIIESPPDTLAEQVESAVAVAQTYVRAVTSHDMRVALSGDLQANKALQKVIEDERTKITKPINEGLRNTNALFKRMSGPLEDAEKAMKLEARRWDSEQERIRLQAAADAARAADAERRRLADEAAKQRAAGNADTAHAIAAAAQFVAPIPVAVAPKVTGESTRETWRAEVYDLSVLCWAIGAPYMMREGAFDTGEMVDAVNAAIEFALPDHKDTLRPVAILLRLIHNTVSASVENVEPNWTVLHQQARALKQSLAIPGVRPTSDKIIAAKAAQPPQPQPKGADPCSNF